MIVFQMFTKHSTHYFPSANIGFKSLAFIFLEILHLQNSDVKFQNFQRAKTKKSDFFKKNHQIIYSLYYISCLKFLASNTNTLGDAAFAMSKISKEAITQKYF